MQLSLAYDIDREVVLIQSPVSGELHAFDLWHLDDFLDWLKSDRHGREGWHAFEMVYRFAGSVKTGGGHSQDFLVFAESEYLEQVRALEGAIADVKVNVVAPSQRMKEAGMSAESVAQSLDRRNLLRLPTVWEAATD